MSLIGPPNEYLLGVDGRLMFTAATPPTDAGPTDAETLFAVDLETETVDWQVPVPGAIPAATEEVVVVTGEYGDLVGVDPASGDERWTETSRANTVCIAGDALVLADPGSRELRTRSVGSGDVLARTSVGESVPTGSVVAGSGRLYLAGEAGGERRIVALG